MRSVLADYDLVPAVGLPHALDLLASGQGWRPIAGGTDLMVLLNAGRLPSKKLVSIRNIAELCMVDLKESSATLGAAATYTQIRQHATLQAEFPLLCQASRWTGGVANQNQGTLGGNIANASPAADSAPPLLIHDATIVLASTSGRRFVPFADFYLGYKQLAMRSNELIVAIRLPRRPPGWRYLGRKVGTRSAQAIAKVSFAAAAQMEDSHIADIRLAIGSVAPFPLRCLTTEHALRGKLLSKTLISEARQTLAGEMKPITDVRSTSAYRTLVAQNLLSTFLESLL